MTEVPRPCWWCGAAADSREHKFKRRDLVQLFGGGQWDSKAVAHGTSLEDEYGYPLSSRADRLKFGLVICRDCNNRRSRHFDEAYDRLSAYVRAGQDVIHAQGKLDWSAVFGADWQTRRHQVIG